MLGGLMHLGEEEIDRIIAKALTNERVEQIARRVTEMLLEQLVQGLQARDAQKES